MKIEPGDTLNTVMNGKSRSFREVSSTRQRCGHCGRYLLLQDGFCADCTAIKDKANHAIEGLIALAFHTPLSDAEIERVMNDPVELSPKDQAAIDSWDIEKIMDVITRL